MHTKNPQDPAGFIHFSTGIQYRTSSLHWANKTFFETDNDLFFIGINIFEISFGNNYLSVSPMGIAAFPLTGFGLVSTEFFSYVWFTLAFLDVLSSPRFYLPIGKHFDVFAGWDAFKLTRMKDISNAWYVTGDLRAGFNCYVNKKFVISSYYEYNHNHNLFTRALNRALGGIGVDIPDQPTALNGHSVGIHIGFSFTL